MGIFGLFLMSAENSVGERIFTFRTLLSPTSAGVPDFFVPRELA